MTRPTPSGGHDDLPALLFLCHRIPFPPDKGDKIRSFHLLQYLSSRYRVYLAAFIDDPTDHVHVAKVQAFCEDTCLMPLSPRWARIKSLRAFTTGDPLSLPYYTNARMRGWIDDVIGRAAISRVLVFSSQMAQYTLDSLPVGVRQVVDFVDVDSDKWSQYAESKPFWSSWIYRREAARLSQFEHRVEAAASASVFVSDAEARLFRERVGERAEQVVAISNGVDTEYFRPDNAMPSPYPHGEKAIVFTGAMDYWANVDAVRWFAQAVMPAVAIRHPEAVFYIVGSKPTGDVLALRSQCVKVTGRVQDVRPYIDHAPVVVAPLRIARGIQNKVLEGMAMEKAVVTTSKGLEGLNAAPDREILVADEPDLFAGLVCRALSGDIAPALGIAARELVIKDYGWQAAMTRFEDLLEGRS